MKRTMVVAVISILAVVAIVAMIGLFLPKQREFVKQAALKSPPEKVFQVVTDVANQASWRNDVQKITIIDKNTWTEVPKQGTPITFKIKRKIENQLFEIEIVEPKSFNGYWVGTFEKTGAGTNVVFKEVVTIENPFFRIVSSLFVDLDKTMEIYLSNVKTKLGE